MGISTDETEPQNTSEFSFDCFARHKGLGVFLDDISLSSAVAVFAASCLDGRKK